MTKISEFLKKSPEKTLITIFWALCTAFFFLLTYYSLGGTYENIDILDEHPYFRPDSILENIIFLLLMLFCLWMIIKTISNVYHKYSLKLSMDTFAGIISVIAAIFSIYWITASGAAPQSDQSEVCRYAAAFNEGDFSGLEIGGYASVCRHQIGMITFLRLIFRLVGNGNYKAYQHFSAIMVGCMIFFCYQITKKLSNDNHKIESIYLLLAFFCVPLYIYVPFVYGEVASTAFVALCSWMLLECLMCKKISPIKLIILGLSGGFAMQLRRNTLIFIIGFFIVIVVKLLSKYKKQALLSGFALLTGILLFQGIIYFLYADKLDEDSQGMPATLYIAMGTNDTSANPGWYNDYNWRTFSACDWDAEWANEEALATIGEFVDKCREDHLYALDFYTRKMSAQWNTPMYQCLVMNNRIESEQSPLAESIYFGSMRSHVESFMNIYQLLVYGSILFLLLKKRKIWKRIEKYVLLIGIFGGFLFSLIWEAKSRYVFPYFLMMLPYAAIGIYNLYNTTRSLHGRYVSLSDNNEIHTMQNTNEEKYHQITKYEESIITPSDSSKLSAQNGFLLLSRYRNALMGFAALWIYFFHEWLPIFSEHSAFFGVESFIKRIGFCGVDIFLFLAGMGITYSIEKTKSISLFYYKRIKRTIFPFIVVAILNYYSNGWSLTQFWQNITGINFYRTNIYSFLWFMPAILTLYLFSPLYYRLFTKSSDKMQFTLCTLIFWLICTIFVRDTLRYDLFGFTNRIPIYIIGILAGWITQNRNLFFDKLTWKLLTFIFLLGLYLSYLTNYQNMYILVPSSNCCVPNILISISLSFLFAGFLFLLNETHFKRLGKGLVKLFSFFGIFTLEFYCIQEWMGSKILPIISEHYGNLITNIIAFSIITVTGLALHYLSKYFWILVEWIAQKLFFYTKKEVK